MGIICPSSVSPLSFFSLFTCTLVVGNISAGHLQLQLELQHQGPQGGQHSFKRTINGSHECSQMRTKRSPDPKEATSDYTDRQPHIHHHHYRHQHRMFHSRKCHPCPAGFFMRQPCSDRSRRRRDYCEKCPPDHFSAHNSYRGQCDQCSRCGEGLYVAHPCDPTRDAVCDSIANREHRLHDKP